MRSTHKTSSIVLSHIFLRHTIRYETRAGRKTSVENMQNIHDSDNIYGPGASGLWSLTLTRAARPPKLKFEVAAKSLASSRRTNVERDTRRIDIAHGTIRLRKPSPNIKHQSSAHCSPRTAPQAAVRPANRPRRKSRAIRFDSFYIAGQFTIGFGFHVSDAPYGPRMSLILWAIGVSGLSDDRNSAWSSQGSSVFGPLLGVHHANGKRSVRVLTLLKFDKICRTSCIPE